ncbi:Predicted oxidoreductase [Nocardioides sp. YR527]|uniref:aldo/keto reductase n=1 Tax=Nocardioides sp. YR527 TaxID=1881028 RepID=UPI0008834F24|nr:aldo/keto reductase [Nocardioides sp. YR527]SDK72109.1 Predicted oxidoreductase [Nocardioides sp. YR527]
MRLRDTESGDPDRDPFRVVNTALDEGVVMIDTAELYGNEELVGRTIAGRRDDVVLASKFGVVLTDSNPEGFEVHADAENVRRSCEASLRRLGTDRIDLYYLHHRSETVPIEETVGAMADLVRQGKIGAIGLSNVTADDLRRAHAVHPVAALQEHWSLAERTVERDLVPAAAELGVTLVAHSPTSHGVLHGAADDAAPADEKQVVLREIATTHGVSAGQLAIAWVHSRGPLHGLDVVPLPGTTRASHVRANVAAQEIVLGPEELRRLTAAWSPTA